MDGVKQVHRSQGKGVLIRFGAPRGVVRKAEVDERLRERKRESGAERESEKERQRQSISEREEQPRSRRLTTRATRNCRRAR